MSGRGYCGIGIHATKNSANVGTLWRSAASMGAAFIFTVGRRFPQQAADTLKAWRHIPYLEVDSIDELPVPKGCEVIGLEQVDGAVDLAGFRHPTRAIYLLGAEDRGLPESVLSQCNSVVQIASDFCLNVATAGSIVLYDRNAKAVA